MEHTNSTCRVWPDAPELRMLRALVREGLSASRRGRYAVCFHGWRVLLSQFDSLPLQLTYVEIRCPDGAMWARFAWQTARQVGDDVV